MSLELPPTCPGCGNPGQKVRPVTLKALLRPGALERLSDPEHLFCRTPQCPIVYFGPTETFLRPDVLVAVFQKEPPGERTVCYCFDVSEADVRRETNGDGAAALTKKIAALVRAGRCACEVRNPQGTCCLRNLAAVVESSQPEGIRSPR